MLARCMYIMLCIPGLGFGHHDILKDNLLKAQADLRSPRNFGKEYLIRISASGEAFGLPDSQIGNS